VVGGVHISNLLTKGGGGKLDISIHVTEYKSITEVNGFYTWNKWNKTSCKCRYGNDISEAKNCMDDKKHEMLASGGRGGGMGGGGLFYKSLKH
jgi:hypothetical protein